MARIIREIWKLASHVKNSVKEVEEKIVPNTFNQSPKLDIQRSS
jgi:hypothetical protein